MIYTPSNRRFMVNRFQMVLQTIVATIFMLASCGLYAIEEITVTATKRAESSQTIPLSISAVSGDELEARGDVEFFDYAVSIPNLSFGATSDGVLSARSISIRGIAGLNTTGVYIDDTPISESIDPRILVLERIEVLRGPTGTLYGARSLGGTVRQITKKATTDELFGSFKIGLSNTDESDGLNYLTKGSVNIPLTENSALLLSGLYEHQAGIFDRAVGQIADHLNAPATFVGEADFVREDVDDRNTRAYQAALYIEATESLTIEPRIMYQSARLDGFPLADIDPDNLVQNRDFDTREGGEDEWYLYTMNINYDHDLGTFTSATSYFERETFEFEGSGSFINFLQALPGSEGGFGLFDTIGVRPVTSPIFQTLNFESFTQEFRFVSDFDGPFQMVAGAFYQDTEDVESFQPRNFAAGLGDNFALLADSLGVPVGEIWPFGDLVFTSERPQDIEELGLYGEFTYDFSEKLSVVFGARYFDSEVEFTNRQAGLAAGVPLADDAPISSISPDGGSQSEDGFNFKLAVEYQYSDDLFLYAAVAEGFRIGGANEPIPPTLSCPGDLAALGLAGVETSSYQSDDLISYELGFKSDVLGDSARINATAFYIDFDNIQQNVQLLCGFQFIGNFGSARSQGLELEMLGEISDNLTVGLNFGYVDAQFTETVTGVAVEGEPLQQVPEITASASFDYVVPGMLADYDFFLRGDVSYVDDSVSRVNATERVRESYEQVGLRFGLRNEKYGFTVFARNLTNDLANLSDNRSLAAETPGRPRFVISRPRTIGIETSFNF